MDSTLEVKSNHWVWKAEKYSFFYTWLSYLFQYTIVLRNQLYDRKILPKKVAPLAVVSIGNLVAGGVGKTQLTLLLVEELLKTLSVSVLSRGYRSKAERKKNPFLVNPKEQTPKDCGDEPWMMASRFPDVALIAGKNRYQGAVLAHQLGADVAVLDDGMQHRKIHRDFEIVVIDSTNPFGGGTFLPKGRLREEPQRLKMADLIVCIGKPSSQLEETLAFLSIAPQVEMSIEAKKVHLLEGGAISDLQDFPVALFCGIGNPQRFVKTATKLGADVVATYFLPDHREMGLDALNEFAMLSQKKGAKLLLCTEKDRVKLVTKGYNRLLPIGWLEVGLKVVKGEDMWNKTVKEIQQFARRSP